MFFFEALRINRNYNIFLITAFLAILLFAWNNRFVQDESFVAFRYVENILAGNGIVYNVGEQVEGHLNLLWILILSPLVLITKNPVTANLILNFSLLFLTLIVFHKLALNYLKSEYISLFALLILGFNFTFSANSTGGSEAVLISLLLVFLLLILFMMFDSKEISSKLLILESFIALLLFLTRNDTIILTFPIIGLNFFLIVKRNNLKMAFINTILLLFPLVLGAFLLFQWKMDTYSEPLPNLYYLKTATKVPIAFGIKFLIKFYASYLAAPTVATLILMFFFKMKSKKYHFNFKSLTLLFVILFWVWYIVKIGGGFREYSLIMPIIPLIILEISSFYKSKFGLNAFILISTVFILSSFAHKKFFNHWGNVKSVSLLKNEIIADKYAKANIGVTLANYFSDSEVKIQTEEPGAIAYYSKLYAIDEGGVINRNATIENSDINISVKSSKLLNRDSIEIASSYYNDILKKYNKPIILMPVNKSYFVPLIYHKQNHVIDSIIVIESLPVIK